MELQAAYVLHARPWRDTSLIADFFTRDFGRVAVAVRGAKRRAKTRVGNPVQPFSPLLISWSGQRELKTSRHLEPAGESHALHGVALVSGLYLNELLTRLLPPEDPHTRLFDRYAQTLGELASHRDIDISLRRFELDLLDELGYGVSLTTAADSGDPLAVDARYRFEPGLGLVPVTGALPGATPTYTGADLLDLAAGRFTTVVRQSAKRLCRQLIDEQLGGRPLQSRALLPIATTD